MSNKALYRFYMTIVVLLFIWLGVHRYLVVRYQFNPWKSGGMAMYTNLHDFDMDITFYLDSVEVDIGPSYFSNATRRKVARFRVRKEHHGKLVSPEKLGQLLLSETFANKVVFGFDLRRIDPATSTLVFTREEFTVVRDDVPAD